MHCIFIFLPLTCKPQNNVIDCFEIFIINSWELSTNSNLSAIILDCKVLLKRPCNYVSAYYFKSIELNFSYTSSINPPIQVYFEKIDFKDIYASRVGTCYLHENTDSLEFNFYLFAHSFMFLN